MRLHESLIITDRNLLDEMDKTILENTVKTNSELSAVKDQANQMHTQKGRELTCDQCSALVLSYSTNYVSQFNSISTKLHAESIILK